MSSLIPGNDPLLELETDLCALGLEDALDRLELVLVLEIL